MSLTCNICNLDISGNNSFTKFDCQHAAHLECYLKDSFYIGINYHCKTCNNMQISQDSYNKIMEEVRFRPDTDTSAIEKLFEENSEFKNDVLKWKKQFKLYKKSKNNLKNKISLLKREYKNETITFVNYIKLIKSRYIKNVKESDEYKDGLKNKSGFTRICNKIQRRWNFKKTELGRFFKIRTPLLYSQLEYHREFNLRWLF